MVHTKYQEPQKNLRRTTGVSMSVKVLLLILLFMYTFTITQFPPRTKQKRQEFEFTEQAGGVRMIETFFAAAPGENSELVDMIITTEDSGHKIHSMIISVIFFYLAWMAVFL